MNLNYDYLIKYNCEFFIIFGDNYAGKSYCLNNIIMEDYFKTSNEIFEDGTTEYIVKNLNNIYIIDTPGLNSILRYQGFNSFKTIWSTIKNKIGIVLLCIDCKQTRFLNTISKFKQMIQFFNSKSINDFKVNLLFNRYINNEETNHSIKEFKSKIPLKLSKFYCYCYLDSKIIKFENEPHFIKTTPGFKYYPNNIFLKDFKIPIGDTTIVKKSFDGKFGKDILKIVWQIQQEFDIPMGAINHNKNIADLLYLYNFGIDINIEEIKKQIIDELDRSLKFD